MTSRITGALLPILMVAYQQRCTRRATAIIKDPHHPLTACSPSCHHGAVTADLAGMLNSFLPQAVRILNGLCTLPPTHTHPPPPLFTWLQSDSQKTAFLNNVCAGEKLRFVKILYESTALK